MVWTVPAVAALCLVAGAGGAAAADPVVDREYSLDLYEGVTIGDTAQIGMGGAGAARLVGSAGALLNAAAPAVRQTTDRKRWSWDYHLDALTARSSRDYDNNGVEADGGASMITSGFALRVGAWAGALTAIAQTQPLDGGALDATALRAKLVIARWLPRYDLAVGIGVQVVSLVLGRPDRDDPLFSITGAGLLAGATWVPAMENHRAGLALETPIAGADVAAADCDPEDCDGYILPREVESPARLVAGGAYRWAATAWNQPYPFRFRDERAITAAADLVVTGPTRRGHGLEAFGVHELQRSGRSVSISLRAGAECECLPGRLRVRAGSYWEPGRFDGVSGRLHATLGADVRVFQFHLWGVRRGRISGTADVAARYQNIALSIGFWR